MLCNKNLTSLMKIVLTIPYKATNLPERVGFDVSDAADAAFWADHQHHVSFISGRSLDQSAMIEQMLRVYHYS